MVAAMWAAVIVPLGIIGWIGASMREAMLPMQAYAVILLLALAALGPALHHSPVGTGSPRTGPSSA